MEDNLELKQILVNGTELNYIEQGTGVPVVFVHGSLGDYRTFNFQFEPFSKHFRVISYSRRYHYPNKWKGDGKDYSVALHANDLASFIKELATEPVHLAATSYGAYVSLYMASKNPELVRSLVLGEPPILPWLEKVEGGKALKDEFLTNSFGPARDAFKAGKMEEGVGLFIDGVMGQGTFSRLNPRAKGSMLDNAEEMKAETTADDYFSPFTFEDASKIQSPVLLLSGERSPKLFHLIVDSLEKCLPQSKRVLVPDASHSMQTGNYQFYNKVVLDFLAA